MKGLSTAIPAPDYRVAQLSARGEAAIFDGDDDRLLGVKRGADLARITVR
jgi:hypothetical protein